MKAIIWDGSGTAEAARPNDRCQYEIAVSQKSGAASRSFILAPTNVCSCTRDGAVLGVGRQFVVRGRVPVFFSGTPHLVSSLV